VSHDASSSIPEAERVAVVLRRICGRRPPIDLVRKWLDHHESVGEWDDLQDWVGINMPPWEWAATIAVIEAAEHIARESRY
jgi:hypothetical protein